MEEKVRGGAKMSKAMIVVNPSSGREQANNYVDQLTNELKNEFGDITVQTTETDGDARRFADEAAVKRYDALFLMGGDGTINEGVNGIARYDYRPCVGVIPLGTVNNFAQSLGLPTKPEEAISQLKTAGRKKIDIGKVNDMYFVSTVSAGSIPESAQNVDPDSKTKLGPFAYLLAGLKVLNDDQTTLFEITGDGKPLEEHFSLILVALGNSVTGIGTFFPSAEIDDGYLWFMGLRDTNAVEKLSLVPELFQNNEDYSDMLATQPFKKASFRTKNKKTFVSTVDGETGPAFPIDVEVLHQYLTVFSI